MITLRILKVEVIHTKNLINSGSVFFNFDNLLMSLTILTNKEGESVPELFSFSLVWYLS